MLVKTNPNGELVQGWGNNGDGTSFFGSADAQENTHFVQQTTDGGYVFTGSILNGLEIGTEDIYFVKTDPNGEVHQ